MKKNLILVFLILCVLLLTGCMLITPKQFIARLQEGTYECVEYNTNSNSIQSFDVKTTFMAGNRMQYVKNCDNMVKDLYTVNEKYYVVFFVEMKVHLNGIDYNLNFESMRSSSINSNNEYCIKTLEETYLDKKVEGLKKIYIKIIDDNNDFLTEQLQFELVFEDEKNNIYAKLDFSGNQYKITITDEHNICDNEFKGGKELYLRGNEIITISCSANWNSSVYYIVTNDQKQKKYYMNPIGEDIGIFYYEFSFQCDYEDVIITIGIE